MNVNEFIQAVMDEKLGFKFDQPWRLGTNSLVAVVPILRTTKRRRDYITFAEAEDVESRDTGQIDHVYVKNNEDTPLYISRGDIFAGKTQERAAIHGHIIMPHRGLRVSVRCIHASAPIVSSAPVTYSGRVPNGIDLSDQSRTWASVGTYTMNCYNLNPDSSADAPYIPLYVTGVQFSTQPTDDLVGTLNDLRTNIAELLKTAPYIKNQVGAVFFNDSRISGLDIYDSPKSWKAIKDDMLAKEGDSLIKDDENLFEIRPERAVALIKKKLSPAFTERIIYSGAYQVIGLKNNELTGEAIKYKNQIIHLSLTTK